MRNITTTVYLFEELNAKAKEKAREWFRSCIDSSDYETTTEGCKEVMDILGFNVKNIYWSGFSSQGDGACFEGRFKPCDCKVDAIRGDWKDEELLAICAQLEEFMKLNPSFYSATITHSGHYSHSNCTSFEFDWNEDNEEFEKLTAAQIGEAEEFITEIARRAMDWIYKQLRAQNDWLYSDEATDESIIANEYEFEENGEKH